MLGDEYKGYMNDISNKNLDEQTKQNLLYALNHFLFLQKKLSFNNQPLNEDNKKSIERYITKQEIELKDDYEME